MTFLWKATEQYFHVVGDIDIHMTLRDYSHPDDQTTQTTKTPGFKLFSVLIYLIDLVVDNLTFCSVD